MQRCDGILHNLHDPHLHVLEEAGVFEATALGVTRDCRDLLMVHRENLLEEATAAVLDTREVGM